ncbi:MULTISPECIES: YitT family protein [Bacillaceae]|uniref:YitT family protein n=1 Tax=Evansella alkalicola TaxID=745819 RepID=A0ABS6JTD6_9BACI|nr:MULTISPECIES: YitT family protein [Bacillaceae]MBU9721839.1 YitT family protein [Bacillus alkalicola]
MIREWNILEETKKVIIAIGTAALLALSLNLFLIPANVFASGFTGIAQIFSELTGLSPGILLFLLNIPVAILGWLKVGKSFTFYSFLNVAFTTFFLEVIPVQTVSPDIILNSVFGGVLGGLGAGIILKFGASSGGLDILVLLLARKSDRPLGVYFFTINAIIVLTSGVMFGMEKALYTLVTLYVLSRIIDTLHTRHVKLTALIVTNKGDELQQAFHERVIRGITRIPAKGGYTKQDKEILMIVITRYELYELQKIIDEVDPGAFTNIVETSGIFGMFRKDN